jgi:hypothetical protein
VGKDWIARREFERTAARDAEDRQRQRAANADSDRRLAIRQTLDSIAEAMQHYDAEWRGISTYHAKTEALKSANRAWASCLAISDDEGRSLVGAWKEAVDRADMAYRGGAPPPGNDDFQALYRMTAEHFGALLRTNGSHAGDPRNVR